MKIIPFYIPKKFIPKLLNYRNAHLQSTHISIAKDLEQNDAVFLEANKDKLAKIARRNDCHLSFVRNEGFHNKSTKMNISRPELVCSNYMSRDFENPQTPNCFLVFKKQAEVVLPENIQREKNFLGMIKEDIKRILKIAAENKNK